MTILQRRCVCSIDSQKRAFNLRNARSFPQALCGLGRHSKPTHLCGFAPTCTCLSIRMRKLRIGGFKNYPPQVQFDECAGWNLKRCKKPGSDAELLQIVLKLADIDYEVVHQNYDNIDEIVELLENGTMDISMPAVRMTEDRYRRVLYTTPINFLKFGYLIKEVDRLESDDFLMHTFRPEIYLLIMASLLITALCIRLICRPSCGFLAWCWRLFILFFNQDHFFFHPSTKTMFLAGSWILFTFLIVTYYQSKMKSFLTVPLRETVPFNTLQSVLDAIDSAGWKGFVNVNGYSPTMHCKGKQCEQIDRLFAEKKIINVALTEDEDMYNLLSSGRYVTFLSEKTDIAVYDVSIYNKEHNILFIQDRTIAVEMLAFAMNKDFTYELERINRYLDLLITNYGSILSQYVSTLRPFGHTGSATDNARITISMIHLQSFFVLCAIAVGISLLVFGFENFIYRCSWKKYAPRLGELRFNKSPNMDIGVFRRPQTIILPTNSTYRPRYFYGEYLTY
uniref:PBPb domain-containing protein n=1 Tax=Steinernema glaseri TaxID=37863 RepID=A0A1I7ZEG4_9BILA